MTSSDGPLTEQPRRAQGLSPVERRTQHGFDRRDSVMKQLWQQADSPKRAKGRPEAMQVRFPAKMEH